MKTMTFQGRELKDALAQVRQRLGPDALIVSTRQVSPLLGLGGRPMLEVTAALPNPGQISNRADGGTPPSLPNLTPGESKTYGPKGTIPKAEPPPTDAEAEAALQERLRPLQREVRALRAQLHQVAQGGQSTLHKEVEELKAVLRTMGQGAERTGEITPEVARLINLGIERGRAEELLQRAREIHGGTPSGATSSIDLLPALKRAIAERISTAGPVGVSARVAAFVGPTGVGKTTTIAKIAARAALMDGARVSLITIDTFRVGAIDQLQRYADLMELPLHIAGTSAALRTAVKHNQNADLILVDTAGRGPRDVAQLAALRELLGSADGLEVHLCLSTTTRSREQALAISSYRSLQPSRLCITKLDEAISLGEILNLHETSKLPLSYFGTGQRVPEDLELCTPEGFAERLFASAAACGSSTLVQGAPT